MFLSKNMTPKQRLMGPSANWLDEEDTVALVYTDQGSKYRSKSDSEAKRERSESEFFFHERLRSEAKIFSLVQSEAMLKYFQNCEKFRKIAKNFENCEKLRKLRNLLNFKIVS